MKKITKRQAKSLIKKTNGAFFAAQFIKKTGEVRDMVCRTGVHKDLKGGVLSFNPTDKGLAVVYDVEVEGYRMINLNTLRKLKIAGKTYKVA